MPLKLFDFHEKFMIGAYKIKLIQFEKKTGSINKIFFAGKPVKMPFAKL